MRLIFEGPDGSGKTTLQEYVKAQLPDHTCIRMDKPSSHETPASWTNHFYEVLIQAPEKILFSRTFISDPIYGAMLGRRVLITPDAYARLTAVAVDFGYTVVFCNASIRVIRERLLARGGQDEYDRLLEPRLDELVRRYEEAQSLYTGKKLFYHSDRDTPADWWTCYG